MAEHRAAVMRDKAVVSVSTCPIHPKYAAKREPSSKEEGCTCRQIWEATHLVKMDKVTCPLCGLTMGYLPEQDVSDQLSQALYMMAKAHQEKECRGVSKKAKKQQQEVVEAPVQPEAQPEVTETHPDVIVAQRLEAEAEAKRGDSEEQTAMEALAGVAPRKGRLQKGDYPDWLKKINAERLAAKNARLAEKAAAKEAKKTAKAGK